MTRKYILFFIVALITTFSLLLGVFGTKGVLVNRALERQLLKEKELLKVKEGELRSLEHLYEGVWERDSLLEMSKRGGYAQRGEVVYYFFDSVGNQIGEQLDSPLKEQETPPQAKVFQGLSTLLLGLIALAFVSVGTLLIKLFTSRRKRGSKLDYTYGNRKK